MIHFEPLLIVIVVVWLLGKIFKELKLPVIFGELLGGVLVGPLVLGLVKPGDPIIEILAELGIFFLMLHAGLETNPYSLLKSFKKSFLIALSGVILSFGGGYLAAQLFGFSIQESLFIAMCLSCTSIIIPIRLFKDYKIKGTSSANTTISAAIITDILALILFSIVLNVVEKDAIEWKSLLWLTFEIIIFFTGILFIGFKLSNYFPKFLKTKGFSFTLALALCLGLLAELMGLHIILGAFLAGLFIRQEIVEEKIFDRIEDRIYGLSYSFLGPLFFVSLALHLDFTAFSHFPWFFIVIILIAILGKVLGSGLAALFQKIKKLESLVIGLAMNSRGSVELIIASIGLQKEVIDDKLFSILLLTTFVATFISFILLKPLAKNKYLSKKLV